MKQDKRSPGKMEYGVKHAYSIFLRAYPTSFRITFAAEMAEVFSDKVDETARQGRGALLGLAARELCSTAAAIFRSYWSNRSRYWILFWGLLTQTIKAFFPPEPLVHVDGRNSWSQAALEVVLLAVLGLGQVITTYLPNDPWEPLSNFLTGLMMSIPLLWLLVGLARGMPRWAYPSLGIVFGYSFIASIAAHAGPLFVVFLLIALILLVWAYLVERKQSFLPVVFRTWKQSFFADFTRLSFGIYGFLVLAIILAFDDGYANNRTAWLFVSVLCMLGGGAIYSRSRKPAAQLISLTLGGTLSLLAALLDHARNAALSWPGPVWIYSLWASLLILIFLPPATTRVVRFFHRRARRVRLS